MKRHPVVASFLFLLFVDTMVAQWARQNSRTTESLSDVVAISARTAIAVGRNRSILRTTDAGISWMNVVAAISSTQPWNGISFCDSLHGVVIGDLGVVFTTADGGSSWRWHQIPGGKKCLSVLCTGPGSIYVGTDSGWVCNSSDTGKSWIPEKISAGPVRSIFTYRGPMVIGISKYALTPFSLCTQYVIPPPSWGEVVLSNFLGLGSEAFDAEYCNGGGAGFIVGVQGDLRAAPAILRRSLSDTAWHNVAGSIPRDGDLFGVSAPSAQVIYACGMNGMLLRSSDGGDAWFIQSVPTAKDIHAVSFVDDGHGFAVGDSGLILATTNGGLTGVDRPGHKTPLQVPLTQNYPNPFNPSTTFSLRLLLKSYVSLKIFDVMGREVTTILSEELPAGIYMPEWNAANFPSGIYFCRFQAGSCVETRKLVLMR